MSLSAQHIIDTRLVGGQAVCIRRITPGDGARMRDGIRRLSDCSRYLRFFSVQPMSPPKLIDHLLAIDRIGHIAGERSPASFPDSPRSAWSTRSQIPNSPGERSSRLAVVDNFQGRGVGRPLTATILLDAGVQGYTELQALTLAENNGAIGFLDTLGAELIGREDNVLEYHLAIGNAVEALRGDCDPPGLADVFAAFI